MKTRIVFTKFWRDDYISTLDLSEKLAFIYLLTNDQINLCGIYELPDRYVCLDLNISEDRWNKIKNKFTTDNKFLFHKGWVMVINHEKYNTNYKGDRNAVACKREMELVPDSLLELCDSLSIPYLYPTNSPINKKLEIRNKKLEIRNKKLEIINKKQEDVETIKQRIRDKLKMPK